MLAQTTSHRADRFQGAPQRIRLTTPAVVGTPGVRCGRRDAIGVVVRVIRKSRIVSPGMLFAKRQRSRQSTGLIRCEFAPDFLWWNRTTATILRFAKKLDGMNRRQHLVLVISSQWPQTIETLHWPFGVIAGDCRYIRRPPRSGPC